MTCCLSRCSSITSAAVMTENTSNIEHVNVISDSVQATLSNPFIALQIICSSPTVPGQDSGLSPGQTWGQGGTGRGGGGKKSQICLKCP